MSESEKPTSDHLGNSLLVQYPLKAVKVYCNDCTDNLDDGNDSVEMEPEDRIFVNNEALSQSRVFKCALCGHEVCISLQFTREKKLE